MPLDVNQITAVNRMLREMGRAGLNFYSGTTYAPWVRLVGHHKVIASLSQLDSLIPSDARRTGRLGGMSIPLAPSRDSSSSAAFLRANWDFDADPWKLQYYVVLYYGVAAGGVPRLGLSFRLEQPEGRGTHTYWHLQMCQNVAEDKGTAVINCPPELPISYPAFPLNAEDAASLTASIALAMSGRSGLDGLLNVLKGQGAIRSSLSSRYTHAVG